MLLLSVRVTVLSGGGETTAEKQSSGSGVHDGVLFVAVFLVDVEWLRPANLSCNQISRRNTY